jgi:Flp pilus assembly protein TadD
VELDPLDPAANVQPGWVLYFAGRYDEAIAQLKRTLELDPSFASAYMELGWNYAQKRMYSEAVLACQKAVNLEPYEQVTMSSCGMVYGLARRRHDALQLLARLKKVPQRSYLDPYNVMALYVGLGDPDNAIYWLERAYREHSANIYGLKTDPFVNPLRSDPRFQNLCRRMNFPT